MAAALDGDIRAIQEIAEAIDELAVLATPTVAITKQRSCAVGRRRTSW